MANKDDLENTSSEKWLLRLYIAGPSPKSILAFANLKKIYEENLKPQTYQIEVIDLIDSPQLAESHQIFAIPTLIRVVPKPIKKIIGDLSNTAKVLVSLQISS